MLARRRTPDTCLEDWFRVYGLGLKTESCLLSSLVESGRPRIPGIYLVDWIRVSGLGCRFCVRAW